MNTKTIVAAVAGFLPLQAETRLMMLRIAAVAMTATALVGFSRVFLGVHYLERRRVRAR